MYTSEQTRNDWTQVNQYILMVKTVVVIVVVVVVVNKH